MNKNYLPENLYRLRRRAGLSQEEFADKLCVSRQAISKWERGEAYPDTENLIAISRLFSVKVDDLVNARELSAPDAQSAAEGEGRVEPEESENGSTSARLQRNGEDADPEDGEPDTEDEDGSCACGGHRGIRYALSVFMSAAPYPIIVTAAFLLIGFLADGWDWAWTLYITIPVYYSAVEMIRFKRLSSLAMPVLITFVYCLIGMLYDAWHPWWLLYLLIPIYYPIAEAIDKAVRK